MIENLLTIKDINNLIDALDVWETKSMDGELMRSLMSEILMKDMSEEGKEVVKQVENDKRIKSEQEMRERNYLFC